MIAPMSNEPAPAGSILYSIFRIKAIEPYSILDERIAPDDFWMALSYGS